MGSYKLIAAIIMSFSTAILTAADLKLIPSFHTCSVYVDNLEQPADKLNVSYRMMPGGTWKTSGILTNSPNKKTFRGSILKLNENSSYEVSVTLPDGNEIAKGKFTTSGMNVPVDSVHKLPESGHAVISVKGSPDKWIKYTGRINGGNKDNEAILVKDAEYVIIENAEITGGYRHGINIVNSQHIRIINCDISGWGRTGKQDFRRHGVFFDKDKHPINYDGGICIDKSGNLLIERNYIHDPRGTASSWKFAHPAGPTAVYMHSTGGTVIRYNDFIGSDIHRWNDVVEGKLNGFPNGGFARDADIYGNIMIFGNDDSIELDGGQMNIRVWGNHFEGSLCGVSTAPCIFGPTYVFDNLFINPGDIDGVRGSGFKNGYKYCGQGQIYIKNNTVCWNVGLNAFGKGEKPRRYLTSENNVYDTKSVFAYSSLLAEKNNFDYDLIWSENKEYYSSLGNLLKENGLEKHGILAKPEYQNPDAGDYRLREGTPGYGKMGIQTDIPIRPTTLSLDKKQLIFKDSMDSTTVKATIKGSASHKFKVLKNMVFNWFEVSPANGVIKPGETITFQVKIAASKTQGKLRGAFIVKLDDGFSRPVVVYAGKEKVLTLDPASSECAAFIHMSKPDSESPFKLVEAEGATDGKAMEAIDCKGGSMKAGQTVSYSFSVPKTGWYYPAIRFKNHSSGIFSLYVSIDNGPFARVMMRYSKGWCWAGMTLSKKRRGWFDPIKLTKGEHTLTLASERKGLIDCIAILTTPAAVVPYLK